MLIATMLQMLRHWHEGLTLTPAARKDLRARRELAALSPELQRDIGWPPEDCAATTPSQIHNGNRSVAS